MTARSRMFTLIGIGILGLGSTMALSGCTRGANVSIVNDSNAELTNVVATGSGFKQAIGSIPPRQQRQFSVSVPSESGLQLDFDVNGKHFSSNGRQSYFEGGYNTKVMAIVSPDFTVKVDTNK